MSDWQEVAKEFGWDAAGELEDASNTAAERMSKEIVRLRIWSSDSHVTDLEDILKAERTYSEKLREALVAVDGCSSLLCGQCHEQIDLALATKRPGEDK
jgi:hypothetical protein